MFKPLPVFLGLRYFSSGRKSSFLASFISTLAIAGLVLGVALLVIVLSVMNGFDRELRERILSLVPHVQLIHNSGVALWQDEVRLISEIPGVSEVTPYNQVEGLLHVRSATQPVQLLGFEQGYLPKGLQQILEDEQISIPGSNELLLSESLADNLQVTQGQRITLIASGDNGRTTAYAFRVAGLFSTHTELDRALAIASMEQVATITGIPGRVQGFRVQIKDQFKARDVGFQLLRELPYGYGFRDWFQTHGNLYQAIQLSRNMVSLLIFLIIAIAAFNVISMLMMSVVEKRRDVAVLQTLGFSRGDILRLFLTQGALIGLFGIFIGVFLGVLGCFWVADFVSWVESVLGMSFLNTEIYPIDYVPVDLRWSDILTVALAAVGLNVLATVYPALQASRVIPAEELRYE